MQHLKVSDVHAMMSDCPIARLSVYPTEFLEVVKNAQSIVVGNLFVWFSIIGFGVNNAA